MYADYLSMKLFNSTKASNISLCYILKLYTGLDKRRKLTTRFNYSTMSLGRKRHVANLLDLRQSFFDIILYQNTFESRWARLYLNDGFVLVIQSWVRNTFKNKYQGDIKLKIRISGVLLFICKARSTM